MGYKILQVGEFLVPQYDEAIAKGFEALGHEVLRFKAGSRVRNVGYINKIQNRLLFGPNYFSLWKDLLVTAKNFLPDIIYFRRPLEYPRSFLKKLKRTTGAVMVEFMNDDPFGPDKNKHWFRYYKHTIDLFDIHFAFRELNMNEFYAHGAKQVELLLPCFVPELHKNPVPHEKEMHEYDVDALFIGHGENDGRAGIFDAIVENGLSLKLGGSRFEKFSSRRPHEKVLPATYIKGEAYAKSIYGALTSLCLYSKRNRDIITYRAFEIPAIGGLLLAQRNDFITSIFKEGEEAYFFSTAEECVSIIKHLKENPQERNRVAINGQKKVLAGGHTSYNRAASIITSIENLNILSRK